MTHDPLCLRDPDDPDHSPCQCHTIARVRADERERFRGSMELAEQEVAALHEQLERADNWIRADERKRLESFSGVSVQGVLLDLRAKVAAYPAPWMFKFEFLALIDGTTDA